MILRVVVAVTAVVALAACGADPGQADPSAASPDDLVHGVGMVLEDASHGPELCFAASESYPPQCDGVPLEDFIWPDDAEKAGEARFGDYAVEGRYVDGVLQVDRVEAPGPEPTDPGDAGDPTPASSLSDAELAKIQESVSDLPGAYTTYVDAGVVEVGVLFDDGTLQREVDEKHGTGVVRVSSALQPGPLPERG